MAAQCTNNTHSNNAIDAWLSCQTHPSPNPTRGNSHWLLYNLGAVYNLGSTQVWNYNAQNATNLGASSIIIDYSLDGSNWQSLGTFSLTQAPGTNNYTGSSGPNFNGIEAQYVLITFLSNFQGTNCIGISEIQFNIDPNLGNNCGDFAVSNPITDNPIISGIYYANNNLTSTGKVNTSTNVTFKAGQIICLNAGFEVKANGEFLAKIETCSNNNQSNNGNDL